MITNNWIPYLEFDEPFMSHEKEALIIKISIMLYSSKASIHA